MEKPAQGVIAIFGAAIDIDSPPERLEYLDQACVRAPELRHKVEGLLKAYQEAGDFLEQPVAAALETISAVPPIAERPGQKVGPYRLLEEIGEGGFGVVYLAEQQEPVRRQVALKIVKPGLDTRQVIARFEAERQALALMDHPNIARVLDAGATESGRPYFVMELVRGISLTDYCDENRLAIRERLQLFLSLCQAVQHAHQKGIIHRDLKPSNVMIALYDGEPVPKIIDFGVAKATNQQLTDKTLFTSYGQMLGTPLYMSPEQAEMRGMDVDTRSDIYSLGVMLYELLTGNTPFDQEDWRKAGFDEIRRMIREDEPPRPSTRIGTLGAAAATISGHRQTTPSQLGQLLRSDPDWIAMKALAKDRACRYQTAGDLGRDIERYLNKEPIEARPPTLTDQVGKWASRHRALVYSFAGSMLVCLTILIACIFIVLGAYGREKQERAAAMANATQAEKNAASAQKNYEAARQAVRQMLIPVADEALGRIPEMKEVRKRLLKDAAAFYAELLKLNPRDSNAYLERAHVHYLLGNFAAERADRERAIELDPENAGFHASLASFLTYCPDVAFRDPKRGLMHAKRAVELDSRNSDYQYGLIWGYIQLGALAEAKEELRKFGQLDPASKKTYGKLAGAFLRMGDLKNALLNIRKAVALEPSNAGFQAGLADVLMALGENQEALDAINKAIKLNPMPYETRAYALYDIRGLIRQKLGMHASALDDFTKSIELGPFRSYSHMWRALSHFQLKNYAQALADLAKAGDLKHGDSSFLGLIPPELLATCPNAGFQKGILELADREIRWAQQKADSLAQEAAYRYRALIHAAFGNEKEALADCAKGAQFAITFSREASKNQTGDLNRLAWIWSTVADPRWRQPAAAVRLAQRAVEFEPKVASYWTTLGVAYYRNGQPQKAIQALTRAVELGKGDSPIEFFFLALAHQQMKNTPQARQWYGKAMAGMDQKNEEVRRFQVEAAQVLGLPEVLPLPKEEKPR